MVAAQIDLESNRMNERVVEINRLQAVFESESEPTSSKFDQVISVFKKFADEARGEIFAGAGASKEAMAKAEEVRTCVYELFEQTRVTFDVH